MEETNDSRALALAVYMNALARLELTGKTYVSRELRAAMKEAEKELGIKKITNGMG